MKAFFHRLYGAKDKDKESTPVKEKEKFPPLKPWPPPEETQRSISDSPTSYTSFKPLPEVVSPQLTQELKESKPAQSEPKPATPDVHKKVAFISPAVDSPQSTPPIKTTLSRFQAAHGNLPRGSTSSTGASSSKTDLAKQQTKQSPSRAASPYSQKPEASSQSLRSGTPYSQMSQNTSGSRILAATSWSEVTEEDLVSNLGSRERTRQEVLFEIISSEDRYALFASFFLPSFPQIRSGTVENERHVYRSSPPSLLNQSLNTKPGL